MILTPRVKSLAQIVFGGLSTVSALPSPSLVPRNLRSYALAEAITPMRKQQQHVNSVPRTIAVADARSDHSEPEASTIALPQFISPKCEQLKVRPLSDMSHQY